MVKSNDKITKVVVDNGPIGWFMFSAYIGAVIYFFQFDHTFWGGVLAFLKAIFWPAYLIFEALGAFGVR